MGNQGSSTSPIETFVLSSNEDKLEGKSEEQIEEKLYDLYKHFKENQNAFVEFKKEEEKNRFHSYFQPTHGNNEDSSRSLDISITSKAHKFQEIISNLLQREFLKPTITILVFRLAKYLLKEKFFLNLIVKNNLEHLCFYLTCKQNQINELVFIEGCDLMCQVLKIFQDKNELISQNLMIILKIYSVPQKMTKLKEYKKYYAASKLLYQSAIFLELVNTKADKLKNEGIKKDYNDFVKTALADFNSVSLLFDLVNSFSNLDDFYSKIKEWKENLLLKNLGKFPKEYDNLDPITKHFQEQIDFNPDFIDFNQCSPILILLAFEKFCKVKFLFEEKYFRPEIGMVKLFSYISYIEKIPGEKKKMDEKSKTDFYNLILEKIISFTITFFISYCFYNNNYEDDCICNLHPSDKNYMDNINSLCKIYESTSSEDLKFLISALFLLIGFNRDVWLSLKEKNIIQTKKINILFYIKNVFNKNKIIEKTKKQKKIQNITALISIFSFITDDHFYHKIKHTEYFKTYFDIVLLLFYINLPSFRFDILNIMNKFTLFNDCKTIFYHKQNRKIQLILIKRINSIIKVVKTTKEEYENLKKEKEELDLETQMKKYCQIRQQIKEKNQEMFNLIQEFRLLISILVNLIITSKIDENLIILFWGNDNGDTEEENTNNTPTTNETPETLFEDKEKKNEVIRKFFVKLEVYCSFYYTLLKFDCLNAEMIKCINNTIFQIKLAMMLFDNSKIQLLEDNETNKENNKKGKDKEDSKDNVETFGKNSSNSKNLFTLIKLLKKNKKNFEIFHKLIFAAQHFLSSKNKIDKKYEDVIALLIEAKDILSKVNVPIPVIRECLRLFCTLTTGNNDCSLWMKFESSKMIVDSSNCNDVVLNYLEDKHKWNYKEIDIFNDLNEQQSLKAKEEEDSNNKYVIRLPYPKKNPKIPAYNNRMGVITHDQHRFSLPKPLSIYDKDNSAFTIWFRFYNPLIDSKLWHTLLQDETGLISIIAIDNKKEHLGCFLKTGEFIDSCINLKQPWLLYQWVQVALTYSDDKDSIQWYLNGNKIKEIDINEKRTESSKFIFPNYIQYIGNSRDYFEPFGPFCDLRVYKVWKDESEIKKLYSKVDNDENDMNMLVKIAKRGGDDQAMEFEFHKILFTILTDDIVNLGLKTQVLSEEVLHLLLKFMNNMMGNDMNRVKCMNLSLVMRIIEEGIEYKSIEMRKELLKYLELMA